MSTALQADDRAFESLYRLHRPPVYAYALSTMRHQADAEDVTQATFLNAYCALHRGVAPRDDLQWLLAIARNVCRDKFREAKRHPPGEPLNDWTFLPQPDPPPYTVAEVVKELGELSPRHRQILLLREFEGRSYAEISDQLGVSESAVQTLLTRARQALRDELELGMTCAQARRVSIRHLNGVALLEERRALQRHLRRCTECSAFVGRKPRTPVTHMVWIATFPYRKLIALIAGTSSSAGTSAGAGAVAAKLLMLGVVGGAAVGVSVEEVAREPAPHSVPAATKPAAVSHHAGSRHAAPTFRLSRTLPTVAAVAPAAHVTVTHTTHQTAPAAAMAEAPTAPAPTAAATAQTADPPASAAPAAADTASSTPAPAAADTDPASPPAVDSPAPPAPTDAAAAGDPAASAPAADATTPATPAAPAPDPTASAPAPDPQTGPAATPPPARQPNANASPRAVGQGGTPPGQAAKADPTAHGKP